MVAERPSPIDIKAGLVAASDAPENCRPEDYAMLGDCHQPDFAASSARGDFVLACIARSEEFPEATCPYIVGRSADFAEAKQHLGSGINFDPTAAVRYAREQHEQAVRGDL
jgi:hypothetical protein